MQSTVLLVVIAVLFVSSSIDAQQYNGTVYYKIINQQAKTALTVNLKDVVGSPFTGADTQFWEFRFHFSGSHWGFALISKASGESLTWTGRQNAILTAPYDAVDINQITTLDATDSLWAINDKDHANVLDLYRGSTSPDTPILSYGWNKGDNQRWSILPA